MSPSATPNGAAPSIKHIPLFYNSSDSDATARCLIFALSPDWEMSRGEVEFVRFKDGITNTLFKAIKRRPGYNDRQIDEEAILLRAYGSGTAVLIDREREAQSHFILAKHHLAPPLLARFENGLLYRYIEGVACSPEDMRRPDVWPATARLLGRWHGTVPVTEATAASNTDDGAYETINKLLPGIPTPNVWTVMQRWIHALPSRTKAERQRKSTLQQELEASTSLFGTVTGLDRGKYTLSHCDLLSGNIIIRPRTTSSQSPAGADDTAEVSFIDYEYTTPSPAAFDLANHFAEWGGFDCDYSVLPTRSQRRAFIRYYISSYRSHSASTNGAANGDADSAGEEADVSHLLDEVDAFRGIPGLYWGIWALIQAEISQIDFPYAAYAETRLREYWDWKAEEDGSRAREARKEAPEREKRLAREC